MQNLSELNPSSKQRQFLEQYVLGAESTILTLKVISESQRGFSVNLRGPFVLREYKFPNHNETVIDAAWGGPQESQGHLHCCWSEVRFATLTPTNPAVKQNIGYLWQLSFFAQREHAKSAEPRLFCFYLENDNHKAVKLLSNQVGEVLDVA
jgi:hypothetical protein